MHVFGLWGKPENRRNLSQTHTHTHTQGGEHAVQPAIQHWHDWLYNCSSEAESEQKGYYKYCRESVIMGHMLQGWDVSSNNSHLPFIIPDLIHPHIHSCLKQILQSWYVMYVKYFGHIWVSFSTMISTFLSVLFMFCDDIHTISSSESDEDLIIVLLRCCFSIYKGISWN